MTVNENGSGLTVGPFNGGLTIGPIKSGLTLGEQWTDGIGNKGIGWPGQQNIGDYMQRMVQSSPSMCSGNIHVWPCEHAEQCKCKKATRTVEPPKCPGCGKVHG